MLASRRVRALSPVVSKLTIADRNRPHSGVQLKSLKVPRSLVFPFQLRSQALGVTSM